MKKKIFSLTLIIVMLVCLMCVMTGCGNNKENNTQDTHQSESIETGKLDIEVEDSKEFSEGLLAVKNNGKWGYMNKKGDMVIDCLYESAGNFSEGLAVVKKDGKCGYINNKGEVVIDFKYDSADNFSFGYGVGYIGRSKNIVIDKNGNEIINKSYSMSFGPISNNLFIVVEGIGNGYSIVDKDEKIILEGIAQAGINVDGLIPVKQFAAQGNAWDDGKWGFIDEQGKLVIDYSYDFAGTFVDGRAGVVKDGKIGYINKNNEFVIEAKYPYKDNTILRDYSCGLVRINDNDKTIFFDTNGKEVFSVDYGSIMDFSEERVQYEKDNKIGYLDKSGNEVIECKYAHAFDFSDGLAKVYKDEYVNFEFIDKNGKTILAGKNIDNGKAKSSTNEPDVIISSSNTANTNSTNTNSNNTSNSISSNSSTTASTNGTSVSSNTTSTEGIKVGSTIVKYGTYNGDAAASGITLIIKSDGTCSYDGKNGTYSVGSHDFAQDASSKGSIKDCLIIKTDYTYYYYPMNSTTLTDGGINNFNYSGK